MWLSPSPIRTDAPAAPFFLANEFRISKSLRNACAAYNSQNNNNHVEAGTRVVAFRFQLQNTAVVALTNSTTAKRKKVSENAKNQNSTPIKWNIKERQAITVICSVELLHNTGKGWKEFSLNRNKSRRPPLLSRGFEGCIVGVPKGKINYGEWKSETN